MGSLRGRFSGMKQIGALPLTTVGAVVTAAVLTLLACTVVGALLPRLRRARGADASGRPHRLRRGAGAVVAVLVPTLLALATGGLALNRSGDYVPTVSDLVSTATSGKPVTGDVEPLATPARLDAVPASRWRARFTRLDDGSLTTTFRGPVSGLDLSVRVILPQGYSPTDGRTYDVIEGLHGYPGDPGSFSTALGAADALNKAISAGLIPPSIMVMPSLDPDGRQHDCANISGRPAVGTWVAQEIPRMVRATFPNVTTQREGWMALGISAGAYCAGWTSIAEPETFGSAAVMSSYDRPTEGGLATSGAAVADAYTLSHLLAASHPVLGTRFYALGAQDDGLKSAQTAWSMAAVVHKPDTVTTDTPVTGGHAWSLWSARFPTVLAWWGSEPAVWSAVQGSDPTASTTATPMRTADSALLATITTTPTGQRHLSDTTAAWSPVGGPALAVTAVVAACALGVLSLVGRRRRAGLMARSAGELRSRSVPGLVTGWVGRFLVVGGAAIVVAAALGLAGNGVTGYLTTWPAVLSAL